MNSVSIIGAGYVGLCTGVCLASRGYNLVLSDIDKNKIRLINQGLPPFYEPKLEEMLRCTLDKNGLKAVSNTVEAVFETDMTFICVGTPSNPSGEIDVTFVENAAREIGEALRKKRRYHLIIVKSTVTPGTTEKLVKPAVEKASGSVAGKDFGLAMNPEFLREGNAINDTLNPDRIIIGEYDKKSGDILERFYKDFYKGETPPILRMNLSSAEMVKYANNAFLAMKISFINEVAGICEKIGNVNVDLIAKGIGLDERISPRFLEAGPGWGGSCFPKDIKALITFSESVKYGPIILKAVIEANERQADHVISIVKEELKMLEGKVIAILGLSFKPETDDTRESPAFKIINSLLSQKAKVKVYDPRALENTKKVYGNEIQYAGNAMECITDAECCILVSHWKEFLKLNPETFVARMKTPVLIDTRRLYDAEKYRKILRYRAIGIG